MCILVDTNCFSCVFDTDNKDHSKFSDLHKWILQGKGKIVYGGKKYRAELKEAKKFFGLFQELKKQRKIVEVSDDAVDQEHARVEKLINPKKFDDPHLVAIVVVARVMLVCTQDAGAKDLLRDSSVYPKAGMRPSIYSSNRNSKLLSDEYIAEVCK